MAAQTFITKLNLPADSRLKKVSGIDTVKILAVMVDFPADKDAATEGNGKFGTIYSKDYGNSILDPLPHDRNYFEAHLEFVKNYFEKASGGKEKVEFYVLPGIITVSKQMRNYSPPYNSTSYSELGNFAEEVWHLADSANPGFNFSNYNLFTIFHAGVGKEVSLPGSLSDSRDLPSIYFSESALKNIYGSSFDGFPVDKNTFKIKNSMIIPETESREQTNIDGSASLAQITINGLLVSSVGNFLGLPDLYDTKTGLSAIGRFGLMDPQSIFAYNGVFPPEPSAWEKIFLGWATPVTLSPGNYNVDLVTKLAASLSDTTILKIPINSSEYFLVENRQRDASHNGAIITYVLGGDTLTKTFTKDETGFLSYDTDSLQGVITDVDEFDWALPGQIDDTSHYSGGILIWHIDDNIIHANFADDKINADKNHRGVNLMEASGVPEIGEQFTDLFGNTIVGEGTYQDYWYASNSATLYHNRFADDTRPSSKSNTGANSLITLSDFSNIGNTMSFKIAYGDSLVKPVTSLSVPFTISNNKLDVFQTADSSNFCVLSNSNLEIMNDTGSIIKTIADFSSFKTASVKLNNTEYIVGAIDSTLNVYMNNGSSSYAGSINTGDLINAAPVIITENSVAEIIVGTKSGYIKKYSLGTLPATNPSLVSSDSSNMGSQINQIAGTENYFSFVTTAIAVNVNNQGYNGKYFLTLNDNQNNRFITGTDGFLQLSITNDKQGNKTNILLLAGNKFDVVTNGKLVGSFSINSSDSIKSFALADLKQDGSNYIVFTDGNNIDAVNLQGAEADNFPFVDPKGIGFTGTPLTADFAGDNKSEVIAATDDGRIYAIDGGTGKVVDGFPVSSGAQLACMPALFEYQGRLSFAMLNRQGNFSAWQIGANQGKVFWAEENGSSGNNSYIAGASNQNIDNTFFPAARAYNYPNPVYGGVTNIHYYVAQDSKIDIKIFDLAGDFVAELTDSAPGGFEKETPWNVGSIQSGVYFASIKATGANGKSETNIIKIAVIK